MPRFYFHIRSPDSFLTDETGIELPSLDRAKAEAEQGARDIMAEDLKAGRPIDHQVFEIHDEAGDLVHSMAFRDALPPKA